MNTTNKKSFIGRAMSKSIGGTDKHRVEETFNIITKELKQIASMSKSLLCGDFKHGGRNPDVLMKMYGYQIPIEDDGDVHGFGDDVSETEQTKARNDDYLRGGFLPIIINRPWLQAVGIPISVYLKCVVFNHQQILRAKRRVEVNPV